MKIYNRKRRNLVENMEEGAGILSESSPWACQEAYRALRTNILFSLPGDETKVIGITSSVMGEGKTTNCINMAIAFAEIGKRVLIIDCDLRRPAVANRLGLQTVPGLSDFLIGQNEFEEIYHNNVRDNLDVITAGSVPPDPTWLLQSKQLETLITSFKSHYDYIFLDLPPVNVVTDASIVEKYVNGYLLVVRDKMAQYPEVRKSIEQLKFAGGKLIGIVYTDVKQGSSGYYRQYYKKD